MTTEVEKTLSSGKKYYEDDRKFSIKFYANLTGADLLEIMQKKFPGVPLEKIRFAADDDRRGYIVISILNK